MPNNAARIQEIQDILRTGVKSTTNDGQTTVFDHASLRRELRELIRTDTSGNYSKRRTFGGVKFA